MSALFWIPQVSGLVSHIAPYMPVLVQDPYSAINIAGLFVFIPQITTFGLQLVEDKDYDNVHPRISIKKHLEAKGLISRLYAAHQNSMESFQFFAAGMIAASHTMVTPDERNLVAQVASLHLVLRAAFIGLYALQSEKYAAVANVRTIIWGLSTMCSSFLLVTAGAKFLTLYP